MAKRIVCFVLLVSLITGLTPLHVFASSTSPVISQLQTGSSVATQEYISIYNNNDAAIDVTGWCVKYSSASDGAPTSLGCLNASNSSIRLKLASHTYLRLASLEFITVHSGFTPDLTFTAGISNTAGYVRLFDKDGAEVDKLAWGTTTLHPEGASATAHSTTKILQRLPGPNIQTFQDTDSNSIDFVQVTLSALPASGLLEEVVQTDVCSNIDGLQTAMPIGYLLDDNANCQQDICANIDNLQVSIPAGYQSLDGENCSLTPLESAGLLLTELLPNATSYDTGNEFIEIYNPNDRPISLKGYTLQLGPSYSSSYSLPIDEVLSPMSYRSFSDVLSGLVLPNSSASVRLSAPAGNIVSETAPYTSPVENTAWALLDDVWQYTNRPTSGAANLFGLVEVDTQDDAEIIDNLAPCPEGKYRNPDTNRCRNIDPVVDGLAPCDEGQTRNPETNRCRSSLGAAATGLAPCKEGQERHPDTNRCRSIVSTASALKDCEAGEERNPETNRCRKSGGASVAGLATVKDVDTESVKSSPKWLLAGLALTGAIGYGFYEWRSEIFQQYARLKKRFV